MLRHMKKCAASLGHADVSCLEFHGSKHFNHWKYIVNNTTLTLPQLLPIHSLSFHCFVFLFSGYHYLKLS